MYDTITIFSGLDCCTCYCMLVFLKVLCIYVAIFKKASLTVEIVAVAYHHVYLPCATSENLGPLDQNLDLPLMSKVPKISTSLSDLNEMKKLRFSPLLPSKRSYVQCLTKRRNWSYMTEYATKVIGAFKLLS